MFRISVWCLIVSIPDLCPFSYFQNTALMSNLVASLFLGDYAPLDYSVGSITNLMDINNKCWSPACLDVSLA